jgi:hypothetical protein
MTKTYGVTLLVSEYTLMLLESREDFIYRFVDTVMAKGKSEPVGIWEIIGLRADKGLEQQIVMLPVYEKAMMNYRSRNMAEAKLLFGMCLELYPNDNVSALYLQRCVKFLETGIDDHAGGVTNWEK